MRSNTVKIICGTVIVLVLSLSGWCDGVRADGLELAHELSVTIQPARHRLEAVDRIAVSGHEGRRLEFSLWSGHTVEQVLVNGHSSHYAFQKGRLSISPAPSPAPRQIEIVYNGIYDDPAPVQPLNTDNPGYGVTGTIEEKGTMLLAGAGWYPHGKGRQVFQLSVDAPEGVVAVTSGTPLGHTTVDGRTLSRWSVEEPLRGISLVAGGYTVKTRDFGGVTAATYFSDSLRGLSDSYLDATGRYLQMYADLFGPYAFGQFAVVENFFPTGYGFPGFTLMGRRVLRLPFIIGTSLGHEVAHCWWGNGVLVDASQGNWSEGLTTYVADYLYKEREGQGRSYRQQWLRNYVSLVHGRNEFSLSSFKGRIDPATKAIGYDKAAMVFHMLRRTVGDTTFWVSLKEIYTRHRFQAITWSDIQAVFEEKSGLSLNRFFKQWVFRPGAPGLTLAAVKAGAVTGGFSIQGQMVQERPYYDLTVDVELQTAGDTVRRTFEARGGRTAFAFTVDAEPRQLTVDPRVHLFRRLASREVPPTINRLKGSDAVKVVVADHLGGQAMNIARRLAVALGLHKARFGKAGELGEGDLDRADVIFVGLPGNRQWLAGAGATFSADEKEIRLLGERYPAAVSSFFGVFANARNPERLAAVFIPGDASSASVVSSKIPHYGKYSYLVFKGSNNRVKGTWPVNDSPLVVRWMPGPTLITGGGG